MSDKQADAGSPGSRGSAKRATHVRCVKCLRITKAHYMTACMAMETAGPFPRPHKPPYSSEWCNGTHDLGEPVVGAVKESSGEWRVPKAVNQ